MISFSIVPARIVEMILYSWRTVSFAFGSRTIKAARFPLRMVFEMRSRRNPSAATSFSSFSIVATLFVDMNRNSRGSSFVDVSVGGCAGTADGSDWAPTKAGDKKASKHQIERSDLRGIRFTSIFRVRSTRRVCSSRNLEPDGESGASGE